MRFLPIKIFWGVTFLISSIVQGQLVVPTMDFNNFFVNFQEGFFRPIEIQPILSYKAGVMLLLILTHVEICVFMTALNEKM